jgi:hypothetical protein
MSNRATKPSAWISHLAARELGVEEALRELARSRIVAVKSKPKRPFAVRPAYRTDGNAEFGEPPMGHRRADRFRIDRLVRRQAALSPFGALSRDRLLRYDLACPWMAKKGEPKWRHLFLYPGKKAVQLR